MADIALDTDPDSPTFNDVQVVNGDLLLVDGKEAIKQHVIQRLRIFLGEWFLDNTIGLPFFDQILVKNPDKSKIDALILNCILGTPGIQQVNTYEAISDFTVRSLQITFEAQTISGTVNYQGLIT